MGSWGCPSRTTWLIWKVLYQYSHRFVNQVKNQVTGVNQRGGEEKRITEEFKQKEEKKKELE